MNEQPTSLKKIILTAIVTGIVMGVVQIIFQQYTENSYARFGTVVCKTLWIETDDGQTQMLLSVDDDGGFLTVSGKGKEYTDYRRTVGLSISETGGEIILNGTSGMVIIKAEDGIHVLGEEGEIIGSLPNHPHDEGHDSH
ncbi:MAG: hypothetical protein OXN17_08155 [Candidatus Poribacteria bacterium]|nr:hypothetical protein [Candidatus Poribacteria bacterium]MDE0503278.1 hypothetical protein [Candidatus Poribacteria bacterium]